MPHNKPVQTLTGSARFALGFALALAAVIFFCEPAQAKTYLSDDGNFEYTLLKGYGKKSLPTAVISKYVGSAKTVVVPSKIDGYRVEYLENVFGECDSVRKVIVSKRIERVLKECLGALIIAPS